MWSGVAIARTAMLRNVWKATPSAQSARACAPMRLIPSTPKRCGPGAKRWWARPSDRPASEQFFPSDRRMALGAMLPPLSAVFAWGVLGLSSSRRLQGGTHAFAFAHQSAERRAAGDGLSGRYPHQVHHG